MMTIYEQQSLTNKENTEHEIVQNFREYYSQKKSNQTSDLSLKYRENVWIFYHFKVINLKKGKSTFLHLVRFGNFVNSTMLSKK